MNETTTKAKVTARQLRNMEAIEKHDNQPCAVCGGNNSVTVVHHVIPVERVAKLINNGMISITSKRNTVWLCPTCHAYVHWMWRKINSGNYTIAYLLDKIMNESDKDTALGVVNLIEQSLIEEERLKGFAYE